ncbi:MAG: S-methyl-5-thioribose-1-phosphate isomerase, partial [Acidimicrobiia bacterium]|nr:S-methyl-5-thioribose-1-phosphate isomerase [Acidimicrobiia bacterium]MDX2466124.1 S-methyl-5-thioribose-1-phosphate isomerase [Acidimicrobiia bacterium]
DTIGNARPTAVNLLWAVQRVRDVAVAGGDVATIRGLALQEAHQIIDEDRDACTQMGLHGMKELTGINKILTHCNTGRLATAGWGTALGVIYAKAAAGEPVKVFASETRPLLQGARLTTWELNDAGIDVTLMPDSSSATAMTQGKVEAVIVGADRIAANGDTANKIGTFTHAVNARYAGIPFYVAAPLSTFDVSIATGAEIEIELRPAHEMTRWRSEPTAPEDIPVWNPAFDVTPAELITAIITEVGVLKPPYEQSIRTAFESGGAK